MNKLLSNILVVAAGAMTITICGSCGEKKVTGPGFVSNSYTYEIAAPEAPSGGYKIYLDASGSMPAYFKGDALNDYMSVVYALKGSNDNSTVYFWDDPKNLKAVSDLNSTITKGGYSMRASMFPEIFQQMKEDVLRDNVLAFIVTDGIYSNNSRTTKQRTGYSKADLPAIPDKIKNSLGKDNDLAVAVFRLMMPFKGTYYDIDNEKVPYNGERPMYVFVIGKKGAVADFKQKAYKSSAMEDFRDRNPDALYLGLLEKTEGKNKLLEQKKLFRAEPYTVQDDKTPHYKNVLPNGSPMFGLYANVPQWITTDVKDVANAQHVATLKEKVGDVGAKFDTKYSAAEKRVTLTPKMRPNKSADLPIGTYYVNYSIVPERASKAWAKYSCDDDRRIKTDSTLCDKTFGIKEMIRGFELATAQPDTIYQISFGFQVK